MRTHSNIEINLAIAQQAIQHVRQLLPLGSANKKSDELKPSFLKAIIDICNLREEVDVLCKKTISSRSEFLSAYHAILEKHKAGNCQEQSYAAAAFLLGFKINDIELANVDMEHHFMLIGGNVICDPWYGKAFPTSDLHLHQKYTADFEYNRYYYLKGNVEPTPKSFLSGKLNSVSINNSGKPSIIDHTFVNASDHDQDRGYGRASAFCASRFILFKMLKTKDTALAKIVPGVSRELIEQSDVVNQALTKR